MLTIEHALNYVRCYTEQGKLNPKGKQRDYAIGETEPNYPMPAIRYEVDYIRECFSNETLACVLWYISNPNNPVCLEYWN